MTKAEANRLIESFTEAAAGLGIEVRTERLVGAGGVPVSSGLALVEDQWVIFLEKRIQPRERLACLLESLSRFDLSQAGLDEQAAAYWQDFQASASTPTRLVKV